jgi:hypothetical protein
MFLGERVLFFVFLNYVKLFLNYFILVNELYNECALSQ